MFFLSITSPAGPHIEPSGVYRKMLCEITGIIASIIAAFGLHLSTMIIFSNVPSRLETVKNRLLVLKNIVRHQRKGRSISAEGHGHHRMAGTFVKTGTMTWWRGFTTLCKWRLVKIIGGLRQ